MKTPDKPRESEGRKEAAANPEMARFRKLATKVIATDKADVDRAEDREKKKRD